MRTRTRLLVAGAAGVVVLGGAVTAWLAVTGRRAQHELAAARAELAPLRTGVLAGDGAVSDHIARLQRHSAAAEDATHDPVWSAVAAVPWLGSPAATVQGLTRAVNAVAAQSLPALAAASTDVHPARLLEGGSLDVAGLAASAAPLRTADASLVAQRDAVGALPPSWLGPVREARGALLGQLRDLSGLTTSARVAAEVAPSMLGKDGPRRYFVAFQNPAEARGTGGLLDAFAIVRAEKGGLLVERTGANTQLPDLPARIDGLEATFVDRYGAQGATSLWVNANLSPHFPEVGAAWLAMWRQSTGQQLDGAMALDPTALAGILRATGPVSAPVVGKVGADRIENLVLLEQYQRQELAAQRKQLMLGVGVQAMNAVLSGRATPQALVPRLAEATRGGHLLLYSRVGREQAALARSGLAGAVSDTTGPFAQAVVVNAAGNKLDTWLTQTLSYQVLHCAPSGREVAVTVNLANSAPTKGLPDYVTVRSDKPAYRTVVGQNRVEMQLLVTLGAHLESATLDGVPVPLAPPEGELPTQLPTGGLAAPGEDNGFLAEAVTAGRPSYGMELEVKPAARRTLVVTFREPAGIGGEPVLPLQPMVKRPTATADVAACGVAS